MRRLPARFVIACLCCAAISGCNIFPAWLQPASLWKLNQQDPGGRDSMYFSIADPPRPATTPAQAAPIDDSAASQR
jgi:hypothetical protein